MDAKGVKDVGGVRRKLHAMEKREREGGVTGEIPDKMMRMQPEK